jgi:hypothetical protein
MKPLLALALAIPVYAQLQLGGGSSGGSSAAWSSLQNPTTGLSLSMGTNTTLFTVGTGTSTNNPFSFIDTTGNTGTGSLVNINSVGSSTIHPITITAQGTANGVQMSTAGALAAIGTGSIVATGFSPASGKTLTLSNSMTQTATDGSTVAFGAGGTVAYTNVATLSSLTSIGTIGTGTWHGTIIGSAYGGTGVNNTATLTLGSSNQNWASLGTGIVKNTTTTGALTNAASSDVYGLWTGSCSSSTYLRGDGACATPAGTVTVVGAGTLTSTDCVSGGGSQTIQTPSSNCTIDSSGNVTANTLSTGSGSTGCGTATGCVSMAEASTAAAGASGADTFRASSTGHGFLCTFNGGSEVPCLGPALQGTTYSTATNCASAASPAVCGSAAAGSVAIPTGVTSVTLQVNTTAVTANSQIEFWSDDTLGSRLSVTCNSTLATLVGGMAVTARSAGSSFTLTYNGTIATNPLCLSYAIIN